MSSNEHHAQEHQRLDGFCAVAPDPALKSRLGEEFERLRERAEGMLAPRLRMTEPTHPGFNDGMLFPGTYFPVGTTLEVARRAALERAPLRGTINVVVVLVDFTDKAMGADVDDRFGELFFSDETLPHGSVKEYFSDVSGGLVTLAGEVVGPYRMPRTLAAYAGDQNGTQGTTPNARTLADDAVTAANADVDFAPYDNDGNGFVDAFIVVHAGRGAEQTGSAEDIWSHKWVLPDERAVDGAKVFPYLTIPEDAKTGVCAHELGHLVFGWPDLYDTDYSSEGVGDWCLMGGGSWGLGGDLPTHPSAWCKANQGWVEVVNHTANTQVDVDDVKSGRTVHRLWKDGAQGNEYFLMENRMQQGFDESLPGEGLLVWHIDDAVSSNRDEDHYKVGLLQADGLEDLERGTDRGDDGDSYPGASQNTAFGDETTPSSRSYAGSATGVSVAEIPAAAATVRVRVTVRGSTEPPRDLKTWRAGVDERLDSLEQSVRELGTT
ncbi:M6 family metalloprotease domain-containing protein [Solicola gregarius]|uniref:M6 family metalloprotease domain-containing protein n=1 Tax=Solicola gregarius TaxID=2908642 RepID=A0AA46YKJ3_9ACTN|nr:M6 family metalloprotease domain-containing protein [Solicola gregarius]UYM04526.1 M6 family metalloprotease domain-containing protein [Solicola gregarius]